MKFRSNCRKPGHSFTCHSIIISSIVLGLDLQSLPTHVGEADQSGGVFWSLAEIYITVASKYLRYKRVLMTE